MVAGLWLAAGTATAQDMRPGIASIAVVSAEPDGRYGLDGAVLNAAKLRRTLVTLDDQMAIGHLHLRAGTSAITDAQLAEIRRLATEIGARLLVEKDGKMEPDVVAMSPPAG